MKASDAKRLKELEGENARLKRLLADAELDKDMSSCRLSFRLSSIRWRARLAIDRMAALVARVREPR